MSEASTSGGHTKTKVENDVEEPPEAHTIEARPEDMASGAPDVTAVAISTPRRPGRPRKPQGPVAALG